MIFLVIAGVITMLTVFVLSMDKKVELIEKKLSEQNQDKKEDTKVDLPHKEMKLSQRAKLTRSKFNKKK
jgi:hypothetical protein